MSEQIDEQLKRLRLEDEEESEQLISEVNAALNELSEEDDGESLGEEDSEDEKDSDDSSEDPTVDERELAKSEAEDEEEQVSDAQLQKELEEDKKIEEEEEEEIIAEAKEIDSKPDEEYSDAVDKFMNQNFDELGILLEKLVEEIRLAPLNIPEKIQLRKDKSLQKALSCEDDYTDFAELVWHMISHKVKVASTNSN